MILRTLGWLCALCRAVASASGCGPAGRGDNRRAGRRPTSAASWYPQAFDPAPTQEKTRPRHTRVSKVEPGGNGAAGRSMTSPHSGVLCPCPPHPQSFRRRLHADRAAGRHRHHRRADRPAAAGRPGGPRGGPARPVHQQPQAARPGRARTTLDDDGRCRWASRSSTHRQAATMLYGSHSIFVALLPYIEQQALFNAVNFDVEHLQCAELHDPFARASASCGAPAMPWSPSRRSCRTVRCSTPARTDVLHQLRRQHRDLAALVPAGPDPAAAA